MLYVFKKAKLTETDHSTKEHTPLNATLLASLIRTVQYHSNGSMVPFVRIPGSNPDLVNHALNAGAGGVVMPHIQNAQQASRLADLARFPPRGNRSFPPAALVGENQFATPEGTSVFDVWNENVAVFCQIEDVEGVKNIEEICQVPGIDGILVGTGDLRMSLGLESGSLDGDEEIFTQALQQIRQATSMHGLPVMGFGSNPQLIERRIQIGWQALIVHADFSSIYSSAVATISSCEGILARVKDTSHGSVRTKLDSRNGTTNGH
ncbi:4-hydroxy-2-oxo-heptane-1,7-dioate aldolase [Cercospora beticola]|uniref:4-hydroxy-2-oxo-heptane-1,7-dioate aldolase n=1 Tax=Cercospora beticola TaxID=122368 RepID=A0A2G5IDW8_CERBT|nr:4-hydroxy-2-oxo-heptane-1,7-dioate aldolase [Cercospora beticola]PIB02969.1 4-hydroxy-2-oxo-heptane-1,7-dioate aldolase [Cercospora beticola]WPB04375.1 hypothetical protein RHO25_009021 [Cercospora beticola]